VGLSKIPRVDYDKYLRGGAAGRRALVDGFGDALREHGCARLQGHGVQPGEETALAEVARGLLAALESYFGLPEGALGAPAATALRPRVASGAPADAVLLTVAFFVPGALQLRRAGGEWQPATGNPGELLVVPGPALARLTSSVVAASELRGAPLGAAWNLSASAVALEVRPEFARVDR
jgi:hypothetical protein